LRQLVRCAAMCPFAVGHAHMIVVYQRIAAGIWLLFCVIWLTAALGAKRNIAPRPWWFRIPVRLAIVVILLAVFGRSLRGDLLASAVAARIASPGLALLGLLLCTAGIGYAIWARIAIGANWGMPMTLKQGHELVTSGPYAHVRHPIYSGILLAMLGSALVLSLWWLVIFVANGAQFIYAAKKEEQLMLQTFPNEYPGYLQRTPMLIPFIH
jgi:protein-S-isoprenylcysteine O-methyltransferase Ste14